MYRPQFAYSTPPGCRDEDFVYVFDSSNTPLLSSGFAHKRTVENIPLVLDQDAPFYWRGWKIQAGQWGGDEGGGFFAPFISYIVPDFDVRLRDPYDNYLMDGWIPATHSGYAQNALFLNNSLLTGSPVPLEPEIYCPAGGVIVAFLRNVPAGVFPGLVFYGVKRFKECNP